MSVQAGIWNFDGAPVDPEVLTKISSQTAEYGPDGEEMLIDGNIGMLYRPFHTTAESCLERQPHVFGSGKVMTWDGRLDNRDELISELGSPLNTESTDIAIVAAVYEKWGCDSFAKLVGDWALALWDPHEQSLILSRDYIGVRHLFYYPQPNSITWCTHLSALALPGKRFTLSEEYVAGYLSLHPPADRTPYCEIFSVPPATFVVILQRKITIRSYWTFNPHLRTVYGADSEYEEIFRHLFRQAVRRRLRTDMPILAELSGGLDSSAIVCIADDIIGKGAAGQRRLDTFSFCDRGEPDEEDFLYFPKVEEWRGRVGHHADVTATGDSFSFEFRDFVPSPGFDGREEGNKILRDVVERERYRVLLSGVGGDEFNGQALDFRVQIAEHLAKFELLPAGRGLINWSLRTRHPALRLLPESLNLLLPTSCRFGKAKQGHLEPWIRSEFARQQKIVEGRLTAAEGPWFWPPAARDAFQTIADLACKMTHCRLGTIEKRYPYLDQTLVQFLSSIPTDQLLRPGHRRSLMRRALSGLLPKEVLNRRTKASTGRCVALALAKHWAFIERATASSISARRHFVDQARFHSALLSARDGHFYTGLVTLVKTVALELWLQDAERRGILAS